MKSKTGKNVVRELNKGLRTKPDPRVVRALREAVGRVPSQKEMERALAGSSLPPGAGKSTLVLMIADAMTKRGVIALDSGREHRKKKNRVLLVSSEEDVEKTNLETEIQQIIRTQKSEVLALIRLFKSSKRKSYGTAAVLLLAVLEHAIAREKASKGTKR